MNDMASVIVPKSDQINADDLIARTMTVTVKSVKIEGGKEQPVSIALVETNKVYRPCKIMCRLIVRMWGDVKEDYVGRSMTLYRDPNVKWGALTVGGIRISHMSHIDGEQVVVLQEKRGQLKPHQIKPLKVQQPKPAVDDPAAGWADRYIAAIQNALDGEELDAIRTKQAPRLTEMKAKRPELYARVIEADPLSATPDQPTPAGMEEPGGAAPQDDDAGGPSSQPEGGE